MFPLISLGNYSLFIVNFKIHLIRVIQLKQGQRKKSTPGKTASCIINKANMKTSEIQLENHDDVVSIKDKMSWFTSQRTILVWPKRGRILKSELDLALLQRAARSLGSDLALVTHHEMIREWAEALAIPVYASISTAENEEWKRPAERIKEKRHPKGFAVLQEAKTKVPLSNTTRVTSRFQRGAALFFSLGAFLALFFVLVPSAEITYYPETRLQEIEIAVDASEKYTGINPSGSIPAVMNYMELSAGTITSEQWKNSCPDQQGERQCDFHQSYLIPDNPNQRYICAYLHAGGENIHSFGGCSCCGRYGFHCRGRG